MPAFKRPVVVHHWIKAHETEAQRKRAIQVQEARLQRCNLLTQAQSASQVTSESRDTRQDQQEGKKVQECLHEQVVPDSGGQKKAPGQEDGVAPAPAVSKEEAKQDQQGEEKVQQGLHEQAVQHSGGREEAPGQQDGVAPAPAVSKKRKTVAITPGTVKMHNTEERMELARLKFIVMFAHASFVVTEYMSYFESVTLECPRSTLSRRQSILN